jgi:hypothetical protein
LEVIDELLAETASVTGAETDLLLELRWQLSRRTDAEEALRTFCEFRRRMEPGYYLACFRIRRWLENHLLSRVRPSPAAAESLRPVKLDFYCVEAIRRASLCSALGPSALLVAPRVQFTFRTLAAPVAVSKAANTSVTSHA